MADSTGFASMTGGPPAPGQIATEGINSGQDSLTQFLRSLFNATGTQGTSALSTGLGGTGTAMDYWSKILSGNPAAIMSVMSPEVQAVQGQYRGAQQQANMFAPRGGGRSAMMAQLPMQQAGTIGNIISQARPMAASNLAQTGLGMGGIGANLLSMTMQGQLARRQQNNAQSAMWQAPLMNMATDIGGAAAGGGLGKAFGY
jgi:hypothetical protein